jgi:hypothetical protein
MVLDAFLESQASDAGCLSRMAKNVLLQETRDGVESAG